MPIRGNLGQAIGKGPRAGSPVFSETVDVADGDDVDTGLGTIYEQYADPVTGSPANGSLDVATAHSLNGGTIEVNLASIVTNSPGSDAATLSQQTNTHAVDVLGIGSRKPPS